MQKNAESLKEQVFKSLTGLPKTSFDTLWNFVDPGENCEKLMFYDSSRCGDDTVIPGHHEENKCGTKLKMLPVDQLFILLVWLKTGLNLDFTSWFFNSVGLPQMLKSWINYLYFFSLGAIPIWLAKDQIHQSKPDSFKNTINA